MTRPFLPLLFLAFCMGCGPTLLLPGGQLDGTTAAAPDDWAWTDEVSTVQLESRPADPYSVNIWIVGIEDRLYVHAGANRSAWVENIETDSSVRVRFDETIYALAATRVEDQAEFDVFADAYQVKYGSRPRNEDITEVYLFRLQ